MSEDLREELQGTWRGLNRLKKKMTLKPAMTSGQRKETSFIVITSNLKFISMCRKKNHSNFTEVHWRAQDAHKSGCVARKNVLTTIVMSMWIEVCQIHGQDSRSLLCWTKNFAKDLCGPGGDFQRMKQLPDPIICDQKCGLSCQKQLRKRKSINGQTRNQSSIVLESWEAFTSSIWKLESVRKLQKAQKIDVPMEAAMPLQDGNEKALKWVARNCSGWDDRIQREDKACMYRASSWIHEKAFGIHSTMKSWRSHRRERLQFDKSLSLGAQVYFRCSKRWECSKQKPQWKKNGKKLEKLPAWQLDKVKRKLQPGSWIKRRARKMLFWLDKETKGKSTLLHGWTSVTSRIRS